MNETALLVMAAGMGSRYGGLKQIDKIGPNGEILLDFSVYDAVKAGFNKVVFIIRKDIEKDFREIAGKRIEKMTDVSYVFQELTTLPDGFSVPDGRTKPWGTGHAVYCAKDKINTPFAIINADDYYGQKSYKVLNDHLKEKDEMCMVGFELGNTLTDNGTVSRGVCEVEGGYLKGVVEHTAIDKNSGIPLDSPVSLNMWGLTPDIFGEIEAQFIPFLKNLKNPQKEEFYIPFVIDSLIRNKGKNVRVLSTSEKWYGVTYKEDKEQIMSAIGEKIKAGLYENL